jgi:hypothetical protein
MNKLTVRNIVVLWLAWVVIVIGFQAIATSRLQPQWPDLAQSWTKDFEKTPTYQKGHPYLLDPFMNNQVAWDSEYYLGIATGGYDNPCGPVLAPVARVDSSSVPCTDPRIITDSAGKKLWARSYAFFPFYPLMMYLLSFPLALLGMNPIATATLAGIIISALGTLAAMLALYDLTYETLGEDGAMRAVFYLLIFPTGFFLVQVYTEGLFVGLAFTCLAMLKRKHLVYAALLGAAATLTRAVGIMLVIPMIITWIRTNEWYVLDLEWGQVLQKGIPLRPLWRAFLAFVPAIVFLIWKFSYLGFAFDYIENNAFGRTLSIQGAVFVWIRWMYEMVVGFVSTQTSATRDLFINPQHSAYYFVSSFSIIIGLIAILRCLKTDPEVAWFSLGVFLISFFSGPSQSIDRYVLAAPAVFITLAHWGKNPVFDRAWTIVSILLMGMLAMLYAFNFWVA